MNDSLDNLAAARATLLTAHGLTEQALGRTLARVAAHAVDYADVYLQSVESETWRIEQGIVRNGSFHVDRGFGLRAIAGEETAFAYSQQIDGDALHSAADEVRSIAAVGAGTMRIAQADGRSATSARVLHYPPDNPLAGAGGMSAAAKVALLREIDRIGRALDPAVVQVNALVVARHETVWVQRLDGRCGADRRPLVSLLLNVVVARDGKRESIDAGLGGRHRLEELSLERITDVLRGMVATALINLDARPAPAGTMPVVVGPGWPGMLLHEAIGHGFEGDAIRHGSSVYAGRLGERIAPPGVEVVDDGTVPGSRGSLNIDDEGELAHCTVLIEDGILRGTMHDALSARLAGASPTGNGRRQSYAHLPMPRMTNTYLRAGPHDPAEIIASVDRGLYLPMLGSGQVDIASGNFTFGATEAWLIEKGRITAPVRGATLIGNGPETMRRISMVGHDLALDTCRGECGKAGQTVPVGVGQPTIRIDEMTIGGTGHAG